VVIENGYQEKDQSTSSGPGIKMLERMVAFQKLFELGEDALFSQGEEAGWSRSLSYSEEFSRFIHTLYDSQFLLLSTGCRGKNGGNAIGIIGCVCKRPIC
jgi:hypothetical protein